MSVVKQALVLLMIALVLAGILWLVHPEGLPLQADAEFYALDLSAPLVSVDDAHDYYESGSHYFVDTRAGAPEGRISIPGSFVIREHSLADDLAEVMDFLYPEDPVILYGNGGPLLVDAVAARLQERGFLDVLILQGGLQAWRDAGHPVDGQEDGHE